MLSRVIDNYDRDSMIFSDGAGAAVIEKQDSGGPGLLGAVCKSYTAEEAGFIFMGKSYFPDSDPRIRYLKMQVGRYMNSPLKLFPRR